MNDMTILQDVLGQLSGGKLLDVATGNGFFIQVLLDHLKDFTEIIGIDTNDQILETARTRFSQPTISFQNMILRKALKRAAGRNGQKCMVIITGLRRNL